MNYIITVLAILFCFNGMAQQKKSSLKRLETAFVHRTSKESLSGHNAIFKAGEAIVSQKSNAVPANQSVTKLPIASNSWVQPVIKPVDAPQATQSKKVQFASDRPYIPSTPKPATDALPQMQ